MSIVYRAPALAGRWPYLSFAACVRPRDADPASRFAPARVHGTPAVPAVLHPPAFPER